MLQAVQLGNSGLRASKLCLGTMNFGMPGRGHQGDWTLDADAARPIFQAAMDKGLFYFDCADVYGLHPVSEAKSGYAEKIFGNTTGGIYSISNRYSIHYLDLGGTGLWQ